MNWYINLFSLVILLLSASTRADTLTMKDGSVLIGEVIRQEKHSLTFKTSFAGTIHIKWQKIKALQSDQPITIMLKTEELVATRFITNNDQGISQIKKAGEEKATAFKTDNIAFINPEPWRLNQGYKMTARANISLKSQHGNTHKDEFDLDGELSFKSLQDRYLFSGQLENDSNKGATTTDKWLFSGKYDYFVTKRRYYGIDLSFERDKFTDLDLGTILGPHIGYQFYESKEINLNMDVGPVKVYEEHIEADNSDYLAMNWNINYDQYFFGDITQFYHRHRGLWDWEKSSKVIINSWTGFRFPLRSGFVSSAEVEWKHDSKPNPSIHKSDTTYRLKIGYKW